MMPNRSLPRSVRAAALLLGCCLAFAASAQWQWLDKDGRKIFSDRAPPPDVPEKSILKRPGKPVAAAAVEPGATAGKPADEASKRAGDSAGALPAGKAGPPSELDLKKKQLADAEAARRKADQEAAAKTKAENCARAQSNKATLDSGVRLSRVNAAGQREVFDDKVRAEEMARVQEIISRECS